MPQPVLSAATALWFLAILVTEVLFPTNPALSILYISFGFLLSVQLRSLELPVFAAITGLVMARAFFASGEFHHLSLIMACLAYCVCFAIRTVLLSQVQKTFAASVSQLDALWATVVDGMLVIDDQGIIVAANRAAESIFGYSQEELLQQNIKMLMPPRYAVEHDGYLEAYNTTGTAKIIGIGREVTGMRKGGSQFPLYLAVNKFEVSGKRYYGGIVRDLTEEAKIRAELVEARDTSDAANQTKRKFLSSIGHEVRTPLNAIMGFAQMLQMEQLGDKSLTDPNKQSEYLNHIRQSAEHLLSLFNEILDLAQIESGQMHLSKESVCAQSLLEECVSMLVPMAEQRGVSLHIASKMPEEVAVLADRVRLKQCLANLLTNAVKYNRSGGSVTADIMEDGQDFIRFLVTDTGVGIPTEDHRHLFEPFNRLGREASTIEGTGIGLSMTKNVIESMGGSIGFISREGLGSRFWIDVPKSLAKVNIASVLDIDEETLAESIQVTLPVDQTHTILYIEDNPTNTLLLEQFLSNQPYLKLITVGTAEEGLEIAKKQHIDLVLMDLNLPGMDGFEARAALANAEDTRNIPVIAVSADVNVGTIQKAMNLGFKKYIKKPFDLVEAHATIIAELGSQGQGPTLQ